MDAAVTIAARTHGMMWPDGKPAEQVREVQLMVQEKVDAMVAGAFAAQAAWSALFIKAAFGGVRSPNDLSLRPRWRDAGGGRACAANCPSECATVDGRQAPAIDGRMELLPHLHEYLAVYGYLAVFVIVGLESAGVPVPGETALVAAAILAGEHKLNIYGVVSAAAGRRDPRG